MLKNSTYKLSIGNITDASGNVITNPQDISFTTGPAPVINFNREESGVGNTGSSINAGSLITDIKVDGNYNGFVVDAGYSDQNDKLANANSNTVKIYENASTTPVGSDKYIVGLSEDGKKITIKPNALQKNKIYSVVINGVTDAEGNPIENHDGNVSNQYRFYFQTGDEVAPSIGKIGTASVWMSNIYNYEEIKNGDKNVSNSWNGSNSIVIEFNDTDVIKKNALGSSVYAGNGILENNLIKLTKVDGITGEQKTVNIGGFDRYTNRGIQFIDDSDSYGNGKDKIVITPMSSMDIAGLMQNSMYKLSIGDITDASGNVIMNPQDISFTTGPAPVINLNREESGVGNTGSSINAGSLITDIKVDGNYNGFVVDAGYSDENDKLANVNTSTVKIYENSSNTPIGSSEYNVSLSGDGKKITIKPNANALQKNKIYSVVINGVTDAEGNPIGNHDGNVNNQYRFYFQTGDEVAPSIERVYTSSDDYGMYNQKDLHDGDKGVNINKHSGSIVVEFNDNDVIKKDGYGSSIYAGNGNLINNLIKLTETDSVTGKQILLDLNGLNKKGHSVVTLEDNTDYYSNGKDKIIINNSSSLNMVGFEDNCNYTLTIGNITDASGNAITNPQNISFTTGLSPVLKLDTIRSKVNNTGSGLDSASLITNIKVDGSYSGFVLGEINDPDDKLANVTTKTVKIYENGSSVPIGEDSYTVSVAANGRSMSIIPNENKLQKGKIYSVIVNGVTDTVGNPIINKDNAGNEDNQYRFYFKTEEASIQPPIIVVPVQPVETTVLSTVTPTTVLKPTDTELQKAKTFNISTQPVSPSKVWTIAFTKEVAVKYDVASNIIVLDSSGKIVPVKINILSNKKCITIIPVSGMYKLGETYTLYVNKKMSSAEGKDLKSSYKINFTIMN
ncbi:Ig-like domain-containing protein [Clostridium sp. JS66]|uniref:Ig-like domain-containing protein n=1 Tax=Clostridium sp. JS66 TaxID=3064705 RepID=UPI00298DA610|nr:Ig-like domain-containing protein [Clostridium sp. JS66]WPC40531.1 Ig-like domain-containing protein [Clostridium sp. JS66]